MTTLPSETASETPPAPPRWLLRFDRCERAVHWCTAALILVLLATAAILYVGQLSVLVGRRQIVRRVHVVSGLLLPLPLLVGLVGRWRRGLVADIRAFNRWDWHDRRWLRSRGRDPSVRVGKFNAGQKLNAAFVAGAGVVMLGTGSIMNWFSPFPISWRTGATFVHDWTAFAIALVVLGHLWMALADFDALRGMITGRVPASWARQRRPRWYEEVTGHPAPTDEDAPPREGEPVSRSG
ncbi:MAG TPA: cytochrome b/b6 domain-containing protein [Acidimicrobiales bacterium]|nr:cytochrome b/b6 domain-containing protein [Acidimicrobiales bacterium]